MPKTAGPAKAAGPAKPARAKGCWVLRAHCACGPLRRRACWAWAEHVVIMCGLWLGRGCLWPRNALATRVAFDLAADAYGHVRPWLWVALAERGLDRVWPWPSEALAKQGLATFMNCKPLLRPRVISWLPTDAIKEGANREPIMVLPKAWARHREMLTLRSIWPGQWAAPADLAGPEEKPLEVW